MNDEVGVLRSCVSIQAWHTAYWQDLIEYEAVFHPFHFHGAIPEVPSQRVLFCIRMLSTGCRKIFPIQWLAVSVLLASIVSEAVEKRLPSRSVVILSWHSLGSQCSSSVRFEKILNAYFCMTTDMCLWVGHGPSTRSWASELLKGEHFSETRPIPLA
jgi:hypothetical protein